MAMLGMQQELPNGVQQELHKHYVYSGSSQNARCSAGAPYMRADQL